jgi:CheY-like chemotaxis protein
MANLKGKRIVVIEDDIMNLAVFATSLRQSGATVIQDAWNTGAMDFLIQNLPVDLIVLDIMLRKGISGYDVYNQIKSHPKTSLLPVVGVSSLDPETEIPRAKEKGFDGFISKPIDALNFPEQIAKVIDGEKVWVFSR